ncbi:prolyl oligopeptidase family serine peptidase [Sphingomonas sp. HF-S3]|uniref:Prolyl oligopeptidase family serine peptidase n=1 Tax=Sphingomonas rustica TaxID=3103142 RepID=A0ABV0B754_9SPHN
MQSFSNRRVGQQTLLRAGRVNRCRLVRAMLAASVLSLLPMGASALAQAAGDPAAPDQFTWLAKGRDPAALDWAAKQSEETMRRLTASPDFAAVEAEIKQARAASSPAPSFFLLEDNIVRFVRNNEYKAGAFYVASRRAVADGRAIDWRLVLDMDALNASEGKEYEVMYLNLNVQCLPRKNRCLLPFGNRGSSFIENREFDFSAGEFVKGGFHSPPTRGDFAWLDTDTIIIGYVANPADQLASGFPQRLVAWKRGTPIADAKPVLSAKPLDSMVSATTIGAGATQRGLLTRVIDYSNFELYLAGQDGSIEQLKLPTRLQNFGTAFVTGSKVVVQLADTAVIEGRSYAADTLISYDLEAADGHRVSTVYTPAKGSYVNDPSEGIAGGGDGIAFIETRDLRKTLVIARPAARGWSITRSLSAPPGVAMTIPSNDHFGPGLIVRQTGFLQPTQTSLVLPGRKPIALFSGTPVVDASKFVTEVHSAKSRDGTMIDYYLVKPKTTKPGPVPVILSGYGGYGINVDPSYFTGDLGLGLVPWLTRGGAFSLAAVRGGGERGSAWANSAKGIKRQRTFDDFAAVAQDMVNSGLTAPRRIGSFGRSFGGLLSANMVTQQPDLFGAAIVGVPVTDLFRGVDDGSIIDAGQATETGDPKDPSQVPIMLGYSPYQNIRSGIRYPHVLTVVSAEDGIVGPGYGRRFAAKLQSVGADSLLLEGPTGGHGFPSEFANPKEHAAQVIFFIESLMK